jgi:hypothetical protein
MKNGHLLITLLLTLLPALAAPTHAAVIYVDSAATGAGTGSSWADAYPNLQDALDAAITGDDIWMAQGTYKPTYDYGLNIGDRGNHFRMINGVAIYGGFPNTGDPTFGDRDPLAYETILSGDLLGNDNPNTPVKDLLDDPSRADNSYHVFNHQWSTDLDSTAILDGFTITAGNADDSSFHSPHAEGGGMRNYSSSPTLTNCTFTVNSAIYGGGMDNTGSNLTLTGCTFFGNSASYGGGISNHHGRPKVSDCTFISNSAEDDGGGMYNKSSSPKVTHCTFFGNSASYGGGMYNREYSSPRVTNCTFDGNSAQDDGGGMKNYDYSSPRVTNCTFASNSADRGGGMVNTTACYPTVTNCILWGNTALKSNEIYNYSSTPAISYCDIAGSFLGNLWDPNIGSDGGGNIDADPLFLYPPGGDFHLLPDSPCINAGDPISFYGLNDTDIDGQTRIVANRIDIGADEFLIEGPPLIGLSSWHIELTIQDTDPNPSPYILSIWNIASGELNWHITENSNWLDVSPDSGTSTGQIGEVLFGINTAILEPGKYNSNLTVHDSNAINSPRTIYLTVNLTTTRNVPDEYSTIQDAINAANKGDIVLVSDGTYTGLGNHDIDFLGKAITVKSENGPGNCIIDCQTTGNGRHRGFYFHNYEGYDSALEGFTIVNGYAGSPYGTGGAIFCYNSSPTIENCIITHNKGFGNLIGGGGIACEDSSPIINNCILSYNQSNSGGAIYSRDGDPTISNCIITNNIAEYGGGIYITYDVSSQVSKTVITNCNISQNKAKSESEYSYWSPRGGGIYCGYKINVEIANCAINANMGGAIAFGSLSRSIITNCTLADNYGINGSALHCDSQRQEDPSNIQLNNCILENDGNEIEIIDNTSISIIYSNVRGGYPGTGNIDADPCFVSLGYWDANNTAGDVNDDFFVAGNYRLADNSLCINTGDPNYVPAADETDLAGNPRVMGSCAPRIDMGAYEYYYPPAWNYSAQCNADCDDTNSVNTVDWPILRGAFNTNYWDDFNNGHGPYNPAADFNRDGYINQKDFTEFLNNFGRPLPDQDCPCESTWPPELAG